MTDSIRFRPPFDKSVDPTDARYVRALTGETTHGKPMRWASTFKSGRQDTVRTFYRRRARLRGLTAKGERAPETRTH